MKQFFLVLVVLLLVPCCGCGRVTAPSVPSLVVTEAHNGTSVTLPAGGTLIVRLGANPSTGYQWQMAASPSDAVLRASGSGYDATQTAAVGAGGLSWWTFEAVATGATSLRLRYVRPWEPTTAEREFGLQLTVR